ncbi:biotin-dependent carboxyltransferase family protein [Rhodococcus sp. H29-C3]|uniref:5-oxoprolinase subunit C family protein n=1 Tax=Rhodococcus sp. H29-C3 TaxID=3046307 RepID=UPI0024BA6FBA|nr:biotin-dependent carboxyltransferase family protein [Rhodococcus sp. H29-C3]MDJ0359210.1 biotin-dependent carboxyltransferase family protein [Rhodococcus sp. H29-C3]
MKAVEILRPGPLCTVQDRGRPGHASIGVGRSGAADLRSHDAANRLVGNTVDAATLEATMGGVQVRMRGSVVVAVTGASGQITVNGIAGAMYNTLYLADGDELTVATPVSGLRSYIAARGGFDVAQFLGSRSTDTLSGLGPPPLAEGDVLEVGDEQSEWPATELAPPPDRTGHIEVSVNLGPRQDWFTSEAHRILASEVWTATSESNRVGVKLDGPTPLQRARTEELLSEGMVPGALQVPPSGKPVLFLADHPVTGGYPVIAVVRDADLPTIGQLRPGDSIRFRVH